MLVIRFQRTGKRNMAYFRLVVADRARAVSGKFLEVLGSVDPHVKKIQLNKERISYWLSVGAQPSDSAHNLLIKEGVIKGKKRPVKMKKKQTEENPAEEKPAAETPVEGGTEGTAAEKTESAPKTGPVPTTETPKAEATSETKPEKNKQDETEKAPVKK